MLRKLALHIPSVKRMLKSRFDQVKQTPASPFFHYASVFDAIEVMHRHAVKDQIASTNYLTNFLGVKISPDFFPGILDGRGGEVEGIPIPANWHADIAEWAAALRAVDLSGEKFRVIELGCGWGCWLNNTGVAARNSGREVEMIGVEGDTGHVEFANRAMADNGFSKSEFKIIHGIAAPQDGHALFPVVENAGATWGSEPVINATPEQRSEAVQTGGYIELPAYSLSRLTENEPVDLLHIDIQGGEADFVASALSDLNKLVRYIVIGTHSRQIEGRILEILLTAGWHLEMERPAIVGIVDGRPVIQVDGVQGWRNPRI
jgi:FkbM family methyltransferase